MKLNRKTKIVVGAAALLSALGAGAAVAASQDSSPSSESKAVIDDAAKQLGIPSSKLSDALKQALSDRVDAAVAAGRSDEGGGRRPQGAHSVQRLSALRWAASRLRPLRVHRPPRLCSRVHRITEAQLRTELESGKSLAQIAKATASPSTA